MNYAEWEQQVPDAIRQEPLWDFLAYRKALFLYDICWMDCEKLLQHPLGQPVARQLIRSAGSISANIEEGHGRGFSKDRDYFLRISLGSARESKGWYYRAKALLDEDVLNHRLGFLGEIIALFGDRNKQETTLSKEAVDRQEHTIESAIRNLRFVICDLQFAPR